MLDRIRKNLIEAIKTSSFTQLEISKKLGVTPQTVSCYAKGKKLPALDTFADLCVVLDLDANEILGIAK